MRRSAILVALAAVLAIPAPAGARLLVAYQRDTNLAAPRRELRVSTTGVVRIVSHPGGVDRRRLSGHRLHRLRRAVRAAHFADLASLYRPAHPIGDAPTERVRHHGHTVAVQQGATAPAALERLLTRLRALLD